jgi:amino acid transporter
VTNLGSVFGKLFLVIVSISIFACGLVITTSAGRLIFAMSRDNAFIFSKYFKKVSPIVKVPTAALFLILILSLISTYFAESLIDLVAATAVLPALIYLTTVVAYGLTRKNVKFRSGNFTLGKFSKPVFTFAILWLILEIGILTIPKDFHTAAIISSLMLIIGVIFYFLFFRSRLIKRSRLVE